MSQHTPPTPNPERVRLLVFAASMRHDSLNAKLAGLVARVATENGARVDRAMMKDFDAPSYDGDDEHEAGIPSGPTELRRRLETCDGFVLVAPEYNGSMPGMLKT